MSNQEQVDYMSEAHSRLLDWIEECNLGLCPHCESDTDGLQLLMIDRHAFIACHKCKYYWTAGIITGKEGSTETWLRSLKLLSSYKQVIPFYHQSLETLATDAIQGDIAQEAFNEADNQIEILSSSVVSDAMLKEALPKAVSMVKEALE